MTYRLAWIWVLAVAGGCASDTRVGEDFADGGGDSGPGSDAGRMDDAGPGADGGTMTDSSASCWDGWESPLGTVTAAARPPGSSAAMRIDFTYATNGDGRGEIVLETIAGESVVGAGDGPFMAGVNSGSWVELRDASDATLYTRGVFELIPESLEAVGPDGGFVRVPTCPDPGSIRISNLPNDPAATHVVFFGEPLDGAMTSEASQELVRFALP